MFGGAEERRHHSRLAALRDLKRLTSAAHATADFGQGRAMKAAAIGDSIAYKDALLLAMEREKAAFKLYRALAEDADDEETRGLLWALAAEEAKHKLIVELAYDESEPGDPAIIGPA